MLVSGSVLVLFPSQTNWRKDPISPAHIFQMGGKKPPTSYGKMLKDTVYILDLDSFKVVPQAVLDGVFEPLPIGSMVAWYICLHSPQKINHPCRQIWIQKGL